MILTLFKLDELEEIETRKFWSKTFVWKKDGRCSYALEYCRSLGLCRDKSFLSQVREKNLLQFTYLLINVEPQSSYCKTSNIIEFSLYMCCISVNINPGSRQIQDLSQAAEVEDCFPECCVSPLTSCACCKTFRCDRWLKFRWRTRMLVEHRYFEWFILFTVLLSSFVLVSDLC